jgi:acetoin utilization protein AcuB
MGVLLVGSKGLVNVVVACTEPFSASSTVRGVVPAGAPEVEERLLCARFQCQKGGVTRTGHDCLACERYQGWREGPGPAEVTISCRWTDRSPVSACMTTRGALVTIPLGLSCAEADARARSAGIHHLLVTAADRLVGVLCRCDLAAQPPEQPVDAFLARTAFAIGAHATLGEAASAMKTLRMGCLPVVEDGALVGVITRSDLSRVGVASGH